MRSQREHIRFIYKAGVSTRAIAATVTQIFIARQRSPVLLQGVELRNIYVQLGGHLGRREKGIPGFR